MSSAAIFRSSGTFSSFRSRSPTRNGWDVCFPVRDFKSIHVERDTREGIIDSIADYWEPIETGVGSLPQAYAALSDTDRRAVRAEVTARLAQFESNGRLVISVETLIARRRA